ncbi:MAG: phosphoribosyl-ATP pyrophosphohydrolase [Clostridiaceae bacterium]
MKTYNKLVRDNIPEIIKNSGKKFNIRILDNCTYYEALISKLLEEVNEFIESDNPEEIADILEVIEAIILAKNLTLDEINEMKKYKKQERGGFDKKILLEDVYED